MSKILPWRGKRELVPKDQADPNPMWALAVGLVYVFRTGPGARILRELEGAIRQYAKDPAALWRLVQRGEEVIDTTATVEEDKALPDATRKTLPSK
jgi:hypothetical protein